MTGRTGRGLYQSTSVMSSCCATYGSVRIIESSCAADHGHVWITVSSGGMEVYLHVSLQTAKMLQHELRDMRRAIKARGGE